MIFMFKLTSEPNPSYINKATEQTDIMIQVWSYRQVSGYGLGLKRQQRGPVAHSDLHLALFPFLQANFNDQKIDLCIQMTAVLAHI